MANGKTDYKDRLEYMKGVMGIENEATKEFADGAKNKEVPTDILYAVLAKKNAKLANTETLMTIEKVAEGPNGEKIVPVLVTYGDKSSKTMAGVVYAGRVIQEAAEKDNFDAMQQIIYTMMGVTPEGVSEKKDAPVKMKQDNFEGKYRIVSRDSSNVRRYQKDFKNTIPDAKKRGNDFIYVPVESLKEYNSIIEKTSELAGKAGMEYKPKVTLLSIPEGADFVYMSVEAAALYKEAVEHAADVTKQINEAQKVEPSAPASEPVKTHEFNEGKLKIPVRTNEEIEAYRAKWEAEQAQKKSSAQTSA